MAIIPAAVSQFAPAPASLYRRPPPSIGSRASPLAPISGRRLRRQGRSRLLIGRRRGDAGFALVIGPAGDLGLRIGNQLFATGKALRARQWYAIEARYDAGTGLVEVTQTPLGSFARDDSAGQVSGRAHPANAPADCLPGHGRGLQRQDRGTAPRRSRPRHGGAMGFLQGISAAPAIVDLSGNGLHGETVNLPTRGMIGAGLERPGLPLARAARSLRRHSFP